MRRSQWARLTTPGVVAPDETLTVGDAMARYLPWDVRTVELVDPEGPERAAVFVHKRSDTGARLGTPTTERFQGVTNAVAAEVFTAALEGHRYHVAAVGALAGGGITFVAVDLLDVPDIHAAGQALHPFLVFVNPHNGRGSIRCHGTAIRPESSTLLNLGWLTGATLPKLSHTSNVLGRLDVFAAGPADTHGIVRDADRMVTRLVSKRLSPKILRRAIDELTPIPAPEPVGRFSAVKNAAAITRAEKRRSDIRLMCVADDRVGFSGTAWGLFQAVSTWDQHERMFRRMPATPDATRRSATLDEHFTGRQDRQNSETMRRVLTAAGVLDVQVTSHGLTVVG